MSSGGNNSVYLKTAEQVAVQYKVRVSTGLSEEEAGRRRARYGSNALPFHKARSAWLIFLDRFKDKLVILLLVAGGISVLMGEYADALIIAAAIWLDATLSFVQVWRTQRTMERLRKEVRPLALVLRDGSLKKISAQELVVGDVIEFRAGENIPADARLVSSRGLMVMESALTGESDDVAKSPSTLKSRTPLGNQSNMVFSGTTAMAGQGKAIVTAVGTSTEFGKIAQILRTQVSPPSPLRRMLERTGVKIAWVILALVALVTVASVISGESLGNAALTGVTLIVSAIPEDLSVILTVTLTVGVMRILRKKGAVRELSSAETLGATTVICTDKTGTITQGNMKAEHFDFLQDGRLSQGSHPRHPVHLLALTILALLPEAHRTGTGKKEYVGSATERSALEFAESLGMDQKELKSAWQLRDSIFFDTKWKYKAGLFDHPTKSERVVMVMGAPEVLLEKSSYVLDGSYREEDISSTRRSRIQKHIYSLAEDGKRLVGVAWRRHVKLTSITHPDIEELVFGGVLIISDPIRDGVAEAIKETRSAGVKVKLITGDYEPTARALARDVGLSVQPEAVLDGESLAGMSDKELYEVIEDTTVVARVAPVDKQRIVRMLQKRGHVVAMTGDGVNDAVALKSADIGVAMGSGKDIAKDASDLILLDNSFATIVAAIREGRVIRDNLRKVIAFLLATNAAEVAIFIVSLALRLPLPLIPAQILWINLVTDGTSDLALSLEPEERNVMSRSPENPKAQLIGRNMGYHIIFSGIVMTIASVLLYVYLRSYLMLNMDYCRTMVFTFLAVSSLISTWSFRSLRDSIIKRGIWQNPWLFLSAGFSLLLQVAAVYVPVLQSVLQTVPLSLADWNLIFILSLLTVIAVDSRKMFYGLLFKARKRFGGMGRRAGEAISA